ncbi:MAG: preprotein translocase subunit SecE [Verrucomicrobiaceae bacterium]
MSRLVKRTREYVNEVIIELRKATWPWDPKEKGFAKYRELNESTVVVFIAMVLLGAFVAAFDVSFKWAFEAAQKLGM